MRWTEIDFTERLWILPASRTKNSHEHIVPLSASALAILEELHVSRVADCDFVFTTTGQSPISGFAKLKKQLDCLIEAEHDTPIAAWRFHDLRRSGNSKMPRLGVELAVCEKILNHVSGTFGGVVGVYQRYSFRSEKLEALEKWALFLDKLPMQSV